MYIYIIGKAANYGTTALSVCIYNFVNYKIITWLACDCLFIIMCVYSVVCVCVCVCVTTFQGLCIFAVNGQIRCKKIEKHQHFNVKIKTGKV